MAVKPNKFMDLYQWMPDSADANGWKRRHLDAILARPGGNAFEGAIVGMLHAWLLYAEAHQNDYSASIGDDGVLGDEWESMGFAIIGLLNGNTGRLDCGTIDSIVRQAMQRAGLKGER